MNRYIVMEAASQVPSSWKWRGGPRGYRKVALCEVDLPEGQVPKMISERAKGMVRILNVWDRLYGGTSDHCEYALALEDAREYARALNAGAGWNWLRRRPELTAEEVEHVRGSR